MSPDQETTTVAPGEAPPRTGPEAAPSQAPAVNLRRERAAAVSPVATPVTVGSAAQVIIAIAAVLVLCYVGKLVLITLFTSVLLAFVLAPIVDKLEHLYVPRPLGALFAVVLACAVIYGMVYVSYGRAVAFVQDLPNYSHKIRETVVRWQAQARQLEESTKQVLPQEGEEKTVKVEQQQSWGEFIARTAGSITEFVFLLSFIPFLVYFMLTWQGHMRSATVMLFNMENRNTAYVTLGQISAMMRSFIVGNVIVGIFMALLSTVFFMWIGIPYPLIIGVISGFVSLVPYLGVVLAMLPPLAAGLGVLSGTELLYVVGFVMALHVFAINVLYPKILGRRLQLNPLVITVSLLFWGWIWGAMGLVLAIPLTAAMKIIFDHVDRLRPIGAWMGE